MIEKKQYNEVKLINEQIYNVWSDYYDHLKFLG